MSLINSMGTDVIVLVVNAMVRKLTNSFWRSLLDEDTEAVKSGGLIMNIAKQELRELEDRINYASFILAAGVGDRQPIDDWICEARKTAFCLADQIAIYSADGFSDYQLHQMKSHIGMLSIRQLTKMIKGHMVVGVEKGEMPAAVRGSEKIKQLSEISPFIRYSRHMTADAIIRMDDKIKKVEAFLTGTRPVLFITGEQGSGKTTLMKDVYASQKQKIEAMHGKNLGKDDFSQCCWVDIDKTGDLTGLLKKVLKESKIDCNSIGEFEIMKTIHDTFKDKHYFIVLDNVQDPYVLYNLKHVLKDFKWKIICLTRRRDIQEDDNQDVLCIPGLEPFDSVKLLLSAAFHNFPRDKLKRENFNNTHRDVLGDAIKSYYTSGTELENQLLRRNMVELLNFILSKCQGNPQNIWSIGTLLEANPREKWVEIVKRIDDMLIDGTRTRDPPIKLKQAKLAKATIRHCFLYCLAFPVNPGIHENSGIPIGKLIRLWAAEGYLQDSPGQNQEQEAECLLQKLIKKNLLVVRKKDFDGKVLECSVNEHIRPLAEKMCEKQKLCRVVNDESYEISSPSSLRKCFPISSMIRIFGKKTLSDNYRMLAVQGDQGVNKASKALGEDIRLRSLLHFKSGMVEQSKLELSFHRTYMLLRTLELEGTRLAHLPSSIECLVCLRYLGLRNTQLEDLPPTLHRLRHLMCLDIRDTNIAEVTDVSQFTEMRHLYLTNSFRSHSVRIREGLQSLIHLQTLSGAAYGESSLPESSGKVCFEQEISHLRHLRKLSMKKASSTRSGSICDAINRNDSLQSLAISCDRDGQQFDVSPLKIRKNLRKLKLGGPIHNFYGLEMQSITYLYLWDSKLPVDPLHTLQGLENLLLLSLFNAYTGEKMTCCNGKGYEKLKKLSIISMEKLSECKFGPEAMKNLEVLVFAKCGNLRSPPPGLDLLRSLQAVHLTQMLRDFSDEIEATIKDKVWILPDTHVFLKNPFHASSRAATGGS